MAQSKSEVKHDIDIDNATLTVTQGVHSVNMRWKALGGRVVLMGIAKSREEANLAVSKIKGLGGVKSVKSFLRVSGEK